MIEPKVGETITVKGKDYRCIRSDGKRLACFKCDIGTLDCLSLHAECRSTYRHDHNAVYFKEVEE